MDSKVFFAEVREFEPCNFYKFERVLSSLLFVCHLEEAEKVTFFIDDLMQPNFSFHASSASSVGFGLSCVALVPLAMPAPIASPMLLLDGEDEDDDDAQGACKEYIKDSTDRADTDERNRSRAILLGRNTFFVHATIIVKCYDVPSNVFAKFTIRFARRPRHGQGEVKGRGDKKHLP